MTTLDVHGGWLSNNVYQDSVQAARRVVGIGMALFYTAVPPSAL